MSDTETKEISSLSEFIDVISNLNSDSYYFRGESQKYLSITASTFRNLNDNLWESNFYDYKTMINDYYKQVANLLSDLERENFMPYAQHHGLPTPLIDISDNPLTALYFSSEKNKEDVGYVYLFPYNKSIDVSNLMLTDWNRDILQDFVNEDEEVWELFLSELTKIAREDISYFNRMFIDLIYWCSSYASNRNSSLEKERTNLEEKIVLWFEEEDLKISDKELEDIDSNTKKEHWQVEGMEGISLYLSKIYRDKEHKATIDYFKNKETTQDAIRNYTNVDNTNVLGYLILLKSYMHVLNYHVGAWELHHLPIFPNLTVYPTILFDRLLAQDGFFLYQLSMYKKERTYYTQTYLKQNISPEMIIKIKNKEKILKELDAIGINQSKLFPDPDNIAKYMKGNQKYHMKMEGNIR